MEFLVLLFIFLLPTQLGKHWFLTFSYIHGVPIDYLSLILYITDVLVLIILFYKRKVIIKSIKENSVFFLLLLILSLISLIISQVKLFGFYEIIKLFEIILLGIAFAGLTLKAKPFLYVLISSALFELILSILQITRGQSIQGIFYYFGERLFSQSQPGIAQVIINGEMILRPYATFSHPNSLAGFYLLLYAFCLVYKKFDKYFVLKGIVLGILTLLIFISFSKGAIISFIIINGIYFLFFSKITCVLCKSARFLSLSILGIIFLLGGHAQDANLMRQTLLNHSLLIIRNHFFFGVGMGQYLYYESVILNPFTYFVAAPVHNIFLLFFAQVGLIGTIIVGWIMSRILKKVSLMTYLLPILAVILTGIVDHYWLDLQQNVLLLGVVFGLLYSQSSAHE